MKHCFPRKELEILDLSIKVHAFTSISHPSSGPDLSVTLEFSFWGLGVAFHHHLTMLCKAGHGCKHAVPPGISFRKFLWPQNNFNTERKENSLKKKSYKVYLLSSYQCDYAQESPLRTFLEQSYT